MATDIHEQLTKYLTDAHSIEEQALAQLRTAPDLAGDAQIERVFREHLTETDRHERDVWLALDARGAAPSTVKDMLMRIGGKGFLLFARLQPDTPGKLVAHSYSYEALEIASYELLQRVAERADEPTVAELASGICSEERAMLERLAALFDRSVEASLRDVGPDDLREQLRKYLADAHAIEEQAITLLERAPEVSHEAQLIAAYEEHLVETREHAELVQARLKALGGDPSTLKDAALRLGALQWGAFFRAHPDTPGKLAAFAYAFEHLEIGGYEQLKRIAERAGDEQTARIAEQILVQERAAAERVASGFDAATTAALEQRGVAGAR
jgi:ferritin-like metal-binding protein YciE